MSELEDANRHLPPALRERVDPRYRNFAPPGWWPILERLHERLLAIDPDYRLDQAKEKMGALRVYPADAYRERPRLLGRIERATAAAVSESLATCERCGGPGRLRDDPAWMRVRGYILTLCDPCAPEALAEWRRGIAHFRAEFLT